MSTQIKIIIVDDHSIFREGLKKILGEISGIEVIGEAENGAVLLSLLKKINPDIIFLDIKMPVMDGLETTDQVTKLYPGIKIIILSMFGDEEYLYSLVLKGISGFLLKSANMESIERAIKMVHCGQQYFTPELNGLLAKKIKQFSSKETPTFTKKEDLVLHLLCKGYSTEEIAEELHLSKRTVEGFRAKLLQKTGLNSTISLVIYAIRNKLVTIDELDVKQ